MMINVYKSNSNAGYMQRGIITILNSFFISATSLGNTSFEPIIIMLYDHS